ncbi:hypothetical protein DEU56DRAFT_688393, partial [Suillus clintonianus]|uniref:uncharacterized protein n=1 Tax=Suillus clintonianus TaxID=1904413 RepID=UPI001B85CB97
GGPVALIENAMHHRINFLAILCGYVSVWFMQALLLYRCFVIWNWTRHVMIPMVALYIGLIVAIVILVQEGTGAIFYDAETALAYLAFQVVLTVLYTTLVTKRLLSIRGQMKQALAEYDSGPYVTIIIMVVESAMSYTIFIIFFIVVFAMDLNTLSTICFLSINPIQGITQLFIIIRVARGRAVTHEWSTRVTAAPTTLAFA